VVHGDGPAYYDARDVPHGAVTRHVYHSGVTNGERELYVYTPSGYDRKKTYPVLYLVGGSGDLPHNCVYDGRVSFIMDNLLAEAKVVPMVIAIPNNQVVHRSSRGAAQARRRARVLRRGLHRARLGDLASPRLLQSPARSVAHSGSGGTGAQAVSVGRSV